jgi:hypothetical protein
VLWWSSGTPHHPHSTHLSDGVVAMVRDLQTEIILATTHKELQPNEVSEVSRYYFCHLLAGRSRRSPTSPVIAIADPDKTLECWTGGDSLLLRSVVNDWNASVCVLL